MNDNRAEYARIDRRRRKVNTYIGLPILALSLLAFFVTIGWIIAAEPMIALWTAVYIFVIWRIMVWMFR